MVLNVKGSLGKEESLLMIIWQADCHEQTGDMQLQEIMWIEKAGLGPR
jgi:hypothetical protein